MYEVGIKFIFRVYEVSIFNEIQLKETRNVGVPFIVECSKLFTPVIRSKSKGVKTF